MPTQDAEVVGAIRQAGAIVFGKNNLVEMSFGLTGDNNPYGQVKNPRAPNRVSGGSSSGSAAAVAAGIVPAASEETQSVQSECRRRCVEWLVSSQRQGVGHGMGSRRFPMFSTRPGYLPARSKTASSSTRLSRRMLHRWPPNWVT